MIYQENGIYLHRLSSGKEVFLTEEEYQELTYAAVKDIFQDLETIESDLNTIYSDTESINKDLKAFMQENYKAFEDDLESVLNTMYDIKDYIKYLKRIWL